MNQYLIQFEEDIYEVTNTDAVAAFLELVEYLHGLGFTEVAPQDLFLTNGQQPVFDTMELVH